ncbi:FecR domain-containing protein [Cohaesibacter celericrescens]|uniref:FecR domain-containing protein n=1 Tax=Cohaesibacter celericrescens TaxID=2067669 RepID=UPI0035660344
MSVLRVFVFITLVALSFQAGAQSRSQNHTQSGHAWIVAKLQGSAYIAQKDAKAIKVRRGMALEPGQTLSTRARTRLLLVRGKERIQVGSGAIMALPPAKYNKPGKTLILHQSGRLDLTVNKRKAKHFSVKTPYLVATVKGTTFWVDVREGRSVVSVSSGRVEVSNNSSGETTDITRGQTVTVKKSTNGTSTMTFDGTVATKGQKIKVRKYKKNIKKPNFYATVKTGGKTLALQPGSLKKTAPIESIKLLTISQRNLLRATAEQAQKEIGEVEAAASTVSQSVSQTVSSTVSSVTSGSSSNTASSETSDPGTSSSETSSSETNDSGSSTASSSSVGGAVGGVADTVSSAVSSVTSATGLF